MKKYSVLLSSLLIAFYGCNSYEQLPMALETTNNTNETIPIEEAVSNLNAFISDIMPSTRNSEGRLKVASLCAFGMNDIDVSTRSSEDTDLPDTLMYLVNFEDNAGFAVLSANRRLSSNIYAVTENGQISGTDFKKAYSLLNETPQIDSCAERSLKDMGQTTVPALILSAMINDISIQKNGPEENLVDDKNPDFNEGSLGSSPTYTLEKYGPFLKTKWKQRYPFNDLLNGCPAGCVAVATAQIIVANRVSNTMIFNGMQCSWDTLDSVYNYTSPSDPGSVRARKQAANFMKVIGDSDHCDIDYGTDGSSGLAKGAKRTFKALGYHNVNKYTSFSSENKSRANTMLKNGKPVYLDGCISWSSKGHAWVLDGYLLRRENGTEREYYHINWGWNGARDGYYFCGTFDTTCGRFKDSNIDANTNLDKDGCESNYTWTYRMVTYDL